MIDHAATRAVVRAVLPGARGRAHRGVCARHPGARGRPPSSSTGWAYGRCRRARRADADAAAAERLAPARLTRARRSRPQDRPSAAGARADRPTGARARRRRAADAASGHRRARRSRAARRSADAASDACRARRERGSSREPICRKVRRRVGRSSPLRSPQAREKETDGRHDAHLARPRGVPPRHRRRQAHLRRPVPERQPEVPRERADAGARRHHRAHARPRRPRRRHRRPREAARLRPSSRSSSSQRLARQAGRRRDEAAGPEQGRHGRRRRREVHAHERVPLRLGAGRLVRAASRRASSSRPRTARRSTSPATRASSATCS